MNTRLIALACAFAAAACGTESKPAQDPVTYTAAQEPVPSSAPATANDAPPPSNTIPATANAPGTTTTGTQTPVTTPRRPSTIGNSGAVANQDRNTTTASTSPPASPSVANNPGLADQTKSADNTKINDRDRHGALTPMDQGNSSSELQITATIRKGLMGDKSLSFTAKNVKIITVGTKVTLRGPVKSEQEKASIEALAKQTSGVTEVDDQLEVKK